MYFFVILLEKEMYAALLCLFAEFSPARSTGGDASGLRVLMSHLIPLAQARSLPAHDSNKPSGVVKTVVKTIAKTTAKTTAKTKPSKKKPKTDAERSQKYRAKMKKTTKKKTHAEVCRTYRDNVKKAEEEARKKKAKLRKQYKQLKNK